MPVHSTKKSKSKHSYRKNPTRLHKASFRRMKLNKIIPNVLRNKITKHFTCIYLVSITSKILYTYVWEQSSHDMTARQNTVTPASVLPSNQAVLFCYIPRVRFSLKERLLQFFEINYRKLKSSFVICCWNIILLLLNVHFTTQNTSSPQVYKISPFKSYHFLHSLFIL